MSAVSLDRREFAVLLIGGASHCRLLRRLENDEVRPLAARLRRCRRKTHSTNGTRGVVERKMELTSLIPNSHSRPVDVYLPNWKRGCPVALDVSVISTLQQATIQGATSTKGHALLVGEARKLSAHADACHEDGISFQRCHVVTPSPYSSPIHRWVFLMTPYIILGMCVSLCAIGFFYVIHFLLVVFIFFVLLFV